MLPRRRGGLHDCAQPCADNDSHLASPAGAVHHPNTPIARTFGLVDDESCWSILMTPEDLACEANYLRYRGEPKPRSTRSPSPSAQSTSLNRLAASRFTQVSGPTPLHPATCTTGLVLDGNSRRAAARFGKEKVTSCRLQAKVIRLCRVHRDGFMI